MRGVWDTCPFTSEQGRRGSGRRLCGKLIPHLSPGLSIPAPSLATKSCPCPTGHPRNCPSTLGVCSAAFSLTQVIMLPALPRELHSAVSVTLLHFIMLNRSSSAFLFMSFRCLYSDERGRKEQKKASSSPYPCMQLHHESWKSNTDVPQSHRGMESLAGA